MGNLSHGLEIPTQLVYDADEVYSILLKYECAYIDANGTDPKLQKISDDVYAIGDIGMTEGFHIFEFPHMTSNLRERADQQTREERTGSITALFKRLIPVKLSDTLEQLHGSSR